MKAVVFKHHHRRIIYTYIYTIYILYILCICIYICKTEHCSCPAELQNPSQNINTRAVHLYKRTSSWKSAVHEHFCSTSGSISAGCPPHSIVRHFKSEKHPAWLKQRDTPSWKKAVTRPITPFRTAVPFLGQTTQISSILSPKRDCGLKGVNNWPAISMRWCFTYQRLRTPILHD